MSIGCLAITGAILTVVSIIGLMVEQNIDSRIMVICFCSGSTTNGNTLTVLLLDELRINRRNKESIHSNSPSVLSLTVVFVSRKHCYATSCVAGLPQAIYVPF
ncbi:hypothetical protein TWF703_007911 [Orbilia oligospora]|uniref:Uncharacterized protein n=1 Tax=Orbilia oligospora TaxID=2813651 RepID=A0A7C8JQ63_ORBOL|nr:hypothetical protein TWF703_007911 [Orbilia oligospora]